jgi:hypothetical protein
MNEYSPFVLKFGRNPAASIDSSSGGQARPWDESIFTGKADKND